MPRLHLCDFDGTLHRGDSLLQFLLFSVPFRRLLSGGPGLGFRFAKMFINGTWTNAEGKQCILRDFYRGKTEKEMRNLGAAFARKELPRGIRPELLHTLKSAQALGDRVTIVSASLSLWLRPYAESQDFDLICTEPAFENGIFTGRFATRNCNREEKARRIAETYTLDAYEKVIAYGNPGGDDAMFALADEVFRF